MKSLVGVSKAHRSNMFSVCWRFFLLCLAVAVVLGKRDESVCEDYTKSFGLVPPSLPTNFEYKGELADYVNKSLTWTELYFDNKNLRGKAVLLTNSLEYHLIFDYDVQQIIEYIVIHPGSPLKRDPLSETCIAESIETSRWRYIFGFRDDNGETRRSRMYNAHELLRYGGNYQLASNGIANLLDRGLRTNQFNSCVYDDSIDATLAAEFYFSDDSTLMAAATPLYIEDGVAVGLRSVPVTMRFNGTFRVTDVDGKKTKKRYETEQSLSWFSGDPVFKYGTFKIPEGMYCMNYKGAKPIPSMPPAFSTRIETVSFTQDMNGKMTGAEILFYHQVFYNAEKGLARRDFTPIRERDSEIYEKFKDLGPVKTVYDFTTGIVYVTNKASGRCFARPISFGDFFETSKEQMFIAMGSPEEIFLMEPNDVEYKGKDYARNIDCDIWAGRSFNERMNLTMFLETYISTNGWHEEADEKTQYGVPVRHTVTINQMLEGEFQQTVTETNFFKFKSSPPPLLLFDVYSTGCVNTIESQYLGVILSVTEDEFQIISKYRFYFLEAIQYYLANVTGVRTPLRIQRVKLVKISKWVLVTFALLDRTQLKTSVPVSQKGADMKTAVQNLRKFIDAGNFLVKFENPETGEFHEVMGQPNGLVSFRMPLAAPPHPQDSDFKAMEFLTSKKVVPLVTTEVPLNDGQYEWMSQLERENKFDIEIIKDIPSEYVLLADTTTKPKEKVIKGMSAGGLAGLSIAMLVIGIAVGIAIMYLYIRHYGDRSGQDNYAMQSRK